jgi:hypothetical protein
MINDLFYPREPFFLAIPMDAISAIQLFQKKELLQQFDPLFLYSGVFRILTKKDFKDKTYYYPRTGIGNAFIDNINTRPTLSSETPDLRDVIYFQSGLKPDAQNQLTLNIQTSDITGIYRIRIMAFDTATDSPEAFYFIEVK